MTISAEDLDRLHLKFGKVTEAVVKVEVRVPGTVQPNAYKQVHVVPLAGGVVTQVTAELGQTVSHGQVLAQIFSRDLAEAQTAYVSVNAELEAEHKKLVRTGRIWFGWEPPAAGYWKRSRRIIRCTQPTLKKLGRGYCCWAWMRSRSPTWGRRRPAQPTS